MIELRQDFRCRTVLRTTTVFLFIFGGIGCGDECKTASDCGSMQQCVSGKCTASTETPVSTDETSAQQAVETDDSELLDNPADSDSSDVGEDTGELSTDSDVGDTGAPVGELRDGAVCETAADCMSGHCDGKLCCPAGICCPEPGDASACPEVLCKTRYCDGNYQCRYYDLPLGTAVVDEDASCDGDERCDGSGSCAEVTFCDSDAYKGTGAFSIQGDVLVESCRSSCTVDTHCKSGYECKASTCVVKQSGDDTGCISDADCSTGRCDTALGVCCASGQCCVSDASCGRYACNEETRMCNTVCRFDDEDVDEACSSLGSYHCDSGWCYDDLADGARWCDEDGDCASGYCDPGTSLCCAEGDCCQDDDDCDGTRCQVEQGAYCPETCAPDGMDDDTLCRPYYLCDDGVCVPGILENGEACDDNEMCLSGWCANGYCCDEGECCVAASDCTKDLLCNVSSCDGNHQCVYYAHACGAHDIDGGETCIEENRCDGYGNCVAVSECEGGFTGEVFVCDSGTVAIDCASSCESDNDCLDAYHCEEESCIPDLDPGETGCDNNRDCHDSHCNTVTQVCCVSGYCCEDDNDCAEIASSCDSQTHACRVNCESDDDCDALGNYHCKSGLCEPDLLNGDRFCLSAGECVSGYCDEDTGICCDEGTCCMSDSSCGGFACDEGFSCVTDCTGDDNLCADGWFCNLDVCEPRSPNGALCESDLDCASEHCDLESGVCCNGEGSCCVGDSDCEAENGCRTGFCTAAFSCEFVEKADGESCTDGLFCNGDERCMDGVCTMGASPCNESSTCIEVVCDEDIDDCLEIPVNAGEDCSEPLFCLGNVSMKCTETGICADSGTGEPPCEGEPENVCIEYVCSESERSCEETAKPDGTPCGDDPCEGETVCEEGECVRYGDLPCDDGDPCTTDSCTVSGGNAVCGESVPKADGELCEPDPCKGDGATCYFGNCVPAADRPCVDSNLCTVDVCESYDDYYECGSESREVRSAACGEQITVAGYEFSREIYAYSESCPDSYPGMEIAVAVSNATGTVTFLVAQTDPETVVEVLLLDDRCDPSSCTAHGTGSLAVPASVGQQVFVLEASGIAPPSTMEVSVTCE